MMSLRLISSRSLSSRLAINSLSTLASSRSLSSKPAINSLSTLLTSPSFPINSFRSLSSSSAAQVTRAENTFTNRTKGAFPSLLITGPSLETDLLPLGPFAEAQASFLTPDAQAIESLKSSMAQGDIGVVAHFYMDVELQSVLASLPSNRTFISDSLAMGDAAVKMCDDGAKSIICLGVDFMAESVAAIMSKQGYGHIPVYRSTAGKIGCSLAESAETLTYGAWLTKAKKEAKNPLHVVYINTSLETKAKSSSLVPTITCTSSNVLHTLLQAQLQIPDVSLYYGPDTCMGYNLQTMFDRILENWTDEEIKDKLHPQHTRASIKSLRANLHVFPQGNCVVHHMFGKEVVQTVLDSYPDAYVTAHLEVPGEMFALGMDAALKNKGVVGSTSDILKFITKKVKESVEKSESDGINNSGVDRLQFILGTESGMITSIVSNVQKILGSTPGALGKVECEIIFPVASEAISIDGGALGGIVPGVSGSEGCSTAGGCATCPYMKMNDLDTLISLSARVAGGKNLKQLEKHLPPKRLEGKAFGGRDATEMGVESILFMREMMLKGQLPEELVELVLKQKAV